MVQIKMNSFLFEWPEIIMVKKNTVMQVLLKNLVNVSTTQSSVLTTLKKSSFENIVGKEENAGNQPFLLFPKCFLPIQEQIQILEPYLFLSSATAFNLDQSKTFVVW